MTLGEAKTKVYMLLDEHSAGGEIEHDADIEAKMVYFFDMAQKALSQIRRIVRTKTVIPEPGRTEYPMPADLRSVYRVWRDDRIVTGRYHWRRGRMVVPAGETAKVILVEYFANPAAIPADAPDDYEFEIAGDAAECMPYYVAAQHLLPDLVLDYRGMLELYHLAVSRLSPDPPGGSPRVSQTFYR